jgi:hypothetical protein
VSSLAHRIANFARYAATDGSVTWPREALMVTGIK